MVAFDEKLLRVNVSLKLFAHVIDNVKFISKLKAV